MQRENGNKREVYLVTLSPGQSPALREGREKAFLLERQAFPDWLSLSEKKAKPIR
jgi:hypothetical protein